VCVRLAPITAATPPTTARLPTPQPPTPLPQDNHCDCGLFLLSYLEFFVAAAPWGGLEPWLYAPTPRRRGAALDGAARLRGGGEGEVRARPGPRRPWRQSPLRPHLTPSPLCNHPPPLPPGVSPCPAMSPFPGFLRPDWFCPRNAGLLRDALRARLHALMAAQAGPLAPEGAVARLQALAAEHDAREMR
jgi:hypothetical protein